MINDPHESRGALTSQLQQLVNKLPESVVKGSANKVHAWLEIQKKSLKTLHKKNPSIQELASAVGQMEAFK